MMGYRLKKTTLRTFSKKQLKAGAELKPQNKTYKLLLWLALFMKLEYSSRRLPFSIHEQTIQIVKVGASLNWNVPSAQVIWSKQV